MGRDRFRPRVKFHHLRQEAKSSKNQPSTSSPTSIILESDRTTISRKIPRQVKTEIEDATEVCRSKGGKHVRKCYNLLIGEDKVHVTLTPDEVFISDWVDQTLQNEEKANNGVPFLGSITTFSCRGATDGSIGVFGFSARNRVLLVPLEQYLESKNGSLKSLSQFLKVFGGRIISVAPEESKEQLMDQYGIEIPLADDLCVLFNEAFKSDSQGRVEDRHKFPHMAAKALGLMVPDDMPKNMKCGKWMSTQRLLEEVRFASLETYLLQKIGEAAIMANVDGGCTVE